MKTIHHHEFTLWIYDCERNEEKVPAMVFEEDASYDEIALMMLSVSDLGLNCSLTCDTWSTHEEDDVNVEDLVK